MIDNTNVLRLAVNLRDSAASMGKSFKIRLNAEGSCGGIELNQFLAQFGYEADGVRKPVAPVVGVTVRGTETKVAPAFRRYDGGKGAKSHRTVFVASDAEQPTNYTNTMAANEPKLTTVVFKDYEGKSLSRRGAKADAGEPE